MRPTHAPSCCIALVILPLMLAGCGSGMSTSTATPTTGPGTGTGTGTTTTPSKVPLHGLVAMGQSGFTSNPAETPDNTMAEPNANPNVYVAAVINVTWKQLQPSNGSTLDTSAIDAGLASIATYNAAYPSHKMVAKLRVFAGQNAPAWVLSLDGTPVTGTIDGNTGTFPRFWTANYSAAWTVLQTKLAAVYDSDSRMGEVAVSSCASKTAEPFITTASSSGIALYQAAGYTDAQMQTCLSTVATQYAAWTQTPLDYTFNAFNHLDTGTAVTDAAYTIQVMSAWRTALGTARGVIANHGLQPTLTASAMAIYPEFTLLGPPLEFQSYGPTVDWNATIALGLTYHPSEIELWTTTQAGGSAVISLSQLQIWAGEI